MHDGGSPDTRLAPAARLEAARISLSADPGASALLDSVSPLLERSYLLGQPSVAGMGVGAWDLAVPLAALATAADRAPRMVRHSRTLRANFDDEEEIPEEPEALARGADLVEALQRLQTLPEALPEDARAELTSLRRAIADRLRAERRHHRALDAALGGDLDDPELPERLRAGAPILPEPQRPSRGESVYAPTEAPDYAEAVGGGAPTPELARLAAEIARPAGTTTAALLAKAGEAPPPLHIDAVDIHGLEGAEGRAAAPLLEAALATLPELLNAGEYQGRGRVRVRLDIRLDGADPKNYGRVLADRSGAALRDAGHARVEALELECKVLGVVGAKAALAARLASGDVEGVAALLRDERRRLDASTRGRLEAFFGRDLSEVRVYAGAMSGALARSIAAEAFTFGKMVFFDPQHFRPDTARGEALLAHELTHTAQEDDRDARLKEAEALRAEATYLDWLQPGGAPLAEELPLDPTAPDAADAAEASGALRAKPGRDLAKSEGPRAETARHEERVGQVLRKVLELMADSRDEEAQRVGDLVNVFRGPI